MKKIVLLVAVFALVGCASIPTGVNRMGQFTVASSYNVRNLEYSKASETAIRVEGKNCYQIDKEEPPDARIQRAMDEAISYGQRQGIDGDMLVNVRIDHEVYIERSLLIFKKYFSCITVSGDLVKIEKKK
jgi:hypothetical protein